jgi:hypothetical protein
MNIKINKRYRPIMVGKSNDIVCHSNDSISIHSNIVDRNRYDELKENKRREKLFCFYSYSPIYKLSITKNLYYIYTTCKLWLNNTVSSYKKHVLPISPVGGYFIFPVFHDCSWKCYIEFHAPPVHVFRPEIFSANLVTMNRILLSDEIKRRKLFLQRGNI